MYDKEGVRSSEPLVVITLPEMDHWSDDQINMFGVMASKGCEVIDYCFESEIFKKFRKKTDKIAPSKERFKHPEKYFERLLSYVQEE